MLRFFVTTILLCTATAFAKPATQQTPILPLDQVEIGMEGEWHTVIHGTEIQPFRLKVIGIADNFAGPDFPIIICEALDEDQLESGPVGGMSGSPVYIDGKLIGAYAYGFTWPKRQTLIGVTPIEKMLEVLDYPPSDTAGTTLALSSKSTVTKEQIQTYLKPAPTPAMVSGISEGTLNAFGDEFKQLNFDVMQAPMGTTRNSPSASELKPGSAVAGVFMDGDFGMAATGTLTWREGDKILAFGHPFLGEGPAQMPLASAEIITVVRSVARSFKLSNVGQIVGAIQQDRLPAIAGELNTKAYTTPYSITVNRPGGHTSQFSGNIFEHRNFSPLMAAIATFQSLSNTTEAETESTYTATVRFDIKDHEPLTVTQTWTGLGSAEEPARMVMRIYSTLLNNGFEMAKIERVSITVDVERGIQLSFVESIQQLSGTVRAGGQWEALLTLVDYQGKEYKKPITVPIPENASGQELRLVFADSVTADSYEYGGNRADLQSLADLIEFYDTPRSTEAIYVMLLRESNGLRVSGQSMLDLPPSVRAVIDSPKTLQAKGKTKFAPIYEQKIELGTVFEGANTLTIAIP